ncbi:MAG: ATP-binding protein [Anaerolineales bacterium]|nr:ATP-binding protein [Anaerolineales bacterium]
MTILLTLLTDAPYLVFPKEAWGKVTYAVSILIFVGVITRLLRTWRVYDRKDEISYRLFVILLFITPLTSMFFGIRLPLASGLPPPGLPIGSSSPAVMVFANLPWVIAGGILGPLAAVGLGFMSGLLRALWDTHSLMTSFEVALLAVIFSAAVQQRYRTPFFKLVRRPFVIAAFLAMLYPLIYLLDTSLRVGGSLVSRLDYALTNLGPVSIGTGIELLIAGLFAEVVAVGFPDVWSRPGPLQPSPAELSLHGRFVYAMTPLFIILSLAMMGGSWYIAGRTAARMVEDQLTSVAQVTLESVPYFLETGQNLITEYARDRRLLDNEGDRITSVLSDDLRAIPYFTQLFLIGASKETKAGYPALEYSSLSESVVEQEAIQHALSGVSFQVYTISPAVGESAAQMSFLAAVRDEKGNVQGVLVGRTNLASNPFSTPIINSLKRINNTGGEGILLDDSGNILYHPIPDMLMKKYPGKLPGTPSFFTETGSDGTRRLVYFEQATGRPWSVVLTMPAKYAQQLAMNIAVPVMGLMLVLSAMAVSLLLYSINKISSTLEAFADQADGIAQGRLEHTMHVTGDDEVGRLQHAFEKMRLSLRARMDESSRLLWVSQGVASSLEMSKAIKPILESCIQTEACSARVVLIPDVIPELGGDRQTPLTFELNTRGNFYEQLDEQIISLTRDQDRIVLTNPSRTRLIKFQQNLPKPEAIVAIALRYEALYYGALWMAYDQPHQFSKEEVRYLTTLASQAALAAANARHFMFAEIGRQRLEAIIASTPDPVLVTDQKGRLLLANPEAWKAIGLEKDWEVGRYIDQVITQPDLLALLRSEEEKATKEVILASNRVYSATTSTVMAKGQPVGRICVLRDITHFQELNQAKTDFVHTVALFLRSPLNMMRGYTTMLEMVGSLNEAQKNYIRKISSAVEGMSHLVNNLLDLGRIEAGIGLKLEQVSAADLVEQVVSGLQLLATQKQIQLAMDSPITEAQLIEVDRALLQQALTNLVENAIKFTDPGGRVQVLVKPEQKRVVFEVRDTGVGIGPVDQPRLFEKFYRLSQPGTHPGSGSGLGLTIVKSIVERHKGQVWVESQLGRGSTFYLALPYHQNEEDFKSPYSLD